MIAGSLNNDGGKIFFRGLIIGLFLVLLVVFVRYRHVRPISPPTRKWETMTVLFRGDQGVLKEALQEALQYAHYTMKSGWQSQSAFCNSERLEAVDQGGQGPDRLTIEIFNEPTAVRIQVADSTSQPSAELTPPVCLQGPLRVGLEEALVKRGHSGQDALTCPQGQVALRKGILKRSKISRRAKRDYHFREGEAASFVWRLRDYLLVLSRVRQEESQLICRYFWPEAVEHLQGKVHGKPNKIFDRNPADISQFLKQSIVPKEGGFLEVNITEILLPSSLRGLQYNQASVKLEFRSQLSSGEREGSFSVVLEKRAGEVKIQKIILH
jgi:hypothetical protein